MLEKVTFDFVNLMLLLSGAALRRFCRSNVVSVVLVCCMLLTVTVNDSR